MEQFESIIEAPPIPNCQTKKNFISVSNNIQVFLHYLNMIQFLSNKLENEIKSFTLIDELNVPPLSATLSIKLEQYFEDSYRFILTIAEPHSSYVLSNFFDRIDFTFGSKHKIWSRCPDSLEIDSIEYIIRKAEFPIKLSISACPDPPLQFYVVPDHLCEITGCQIDFFAHILRSISVYISQKHLLSGEDISFDELLRSALCCDHAKMSEIPLVVHSVLQPIPPIFIDCYLSPSKSLLSYKIQIPDLSKLPPPTELHISEEIVEKLKSVNEKKEAIELLCALERNPIEAIEAEIAGHSTMYEMADEKSTEEPKAISDPSNPFLRSTVFYWQSWVSDHLQRYLEENQMVWQRYPSKPKKK